MGEVLLRSTASANLLDMLKQKLLQQHAIVPRTTARMKTVSKQWPDKVEVFRIGRWRVDHLDQEMMRTMRQIADKRGSTIEEVMDRALVDFVEDCVADSELITKVIPFPIKRRPAPNTLSHCRQVGDLLPPHPIEEGAQTMPKALIDKPNVFALLEESRQLHESLCFNTQKLAALIRCSRRRRRQLRRAVAQRQGA